MSNTHSVCFVAQVTLNSTVYYYCSSHKVSSLSMDGNTYLPYIMSVGDTDKIGNFGEGNQVGKCNMHLMFGQKQYQGSYNLNIKLPWNNGTCEIRIYDADNDAVWADCSAYYKGTIKGFTINSGDVSFDVEEINQKDTMVLPKYTVEDVVNSISYLSTADIPQDSVNKRVPMQFGYLDNSTSGVFAKGIAISNRVGMQELYFDTEPLEQFSLTDGLKGIGIWEDGLKRFFVGKYANEYRVKDSNNNAIKFSADSSTTLAANIVDTASDVSLITVTDYTQILSRCSFDADFDDPDSVTANIIAIDSELMLIIEKPTSNDIWVNRGYNDTTKDTHTSGATIYWCASYAAKNLLSFTERFTPSLITNVSKEPVWGYPASILDDWDDILIGSLSNIKDDDTTTYTQFKLARTDTSVGAGAWVYLDMQFPKVNDSISTGDWFSALNAEYYLPYGRGTEEALSIIMIENPGDFESSSTQRRYIFHSQNSAVIGYLDCWSTIDRTGDPDCRPNSGINLTGTSSAKGSAYFGSTYNFKFTVNNLQDLNKRWRVRVQTNFPYQSSGQPNPSEVWIKIYNIGFWIDFFVDYTRHKIMGTLYGRGDTVDLGSVLDYTPSSGAVADTPIKALAYILIYDMGYAVADFDTTSWRLANAHSMIAYAVEPRIGLSYGIDESLKGWDLCQEIASQFGLMLTKSDSGKIKLISLLKLYDNGGYGYTFNMTTYQVSLDDIVMYGGTRKIEIQQTGTDRLRNVVKVNYKRNNSTGEYQAVYPTSQSDLDTYTLTESGSTLSQARTTYYNGQKTETLEINAFAVYKEEDAERLAKWHLNDKAEVHFDVTLSLPYYHYSDKNSKTDQYDVGDLIYLDGIYQGVTFNSTHKFIIQQVKKTDQGRQVQISAKSIEPVSEF